MLTKGELLRTKKQLLFSSDLRSLFVCAGGESLTRVKSAVNPIFRPVFFLNAYEISRGHEQHF